MCNGVPFSCGSVSWCVAWYPNMMSEDAERYAPLKKVIFIDQLVDMHDQLEFNGRTKEAEDMGDFLHKLGKGYFRWLLPLGSHPRTAEWLTQLADKTTEERSRRLEKPWTEGDSQAYQQWLDTAYAMEQTQADETERDFSHVTMQQVWVPCPYGTKEVNMTFPCEAGAYHTRLVKVPRTAPYEVAAPACGAHPRPDGRSTEGGAGSPTHGYNGIVRQMYWGLKRATAEFEDQKARYERVDRKALERATEKKRAQQRALSQVFFNTKTWVQNGGEEDHDGSSSSQSMVANPGGTVVDRALPRHLQHVPRAEAEREGDTPP